MRVDTLEDISLVFFFSQAHSHHLTNVLYMLIYLPSYLDSFRPNLLLLTDNKILYILELTVGFETIKQNNSDRKTVKYSSRINDLSPSYSKVVFVNLSMGALGVMGSSCNSLLSSQHELHFDKTITKRIIMKAMNISIRSSYYIFCRRNKPWTNPELLTI